MDAKLQRRIQRYGWDAAAKNYEAAWRDNVAPAHAAMFKLADLRSGEDVLDVACGSGLVTFRAAGIVGPSGSVLSTDISDEMVRLVQQRAEQTGCVNVQARRMDAEALDVPDEAVDAALCALGLMYVPDPGQATKEMLRVLKPGGRAVAAVWGERRNCGWAELFPIVDSEVQSDVCPLFFGLGTGDSLRATFEDAGFASVEAHRLSVTSDFPNARDALTAMLDGGAVALATKRFDASTRHRVEGRFLESIADFRCADGSYAIPAEFVVVLGRKR